MKLRLSNNWRIPYNEEASIVEFWELQELDHNNNIMENGIYDSSDNKQHLLDIIEKLRTSSVEEFYEV